MANTATMQATVTDYASALEFLGDRSARKIGNNTTVTRLGDWSGAPVAVTLHNTHVIVWHADGSITLNSGGWRTVTTRDRIRAFLPTRYRLEVKRGAWSVTDTEHAETREFWDGMLLHPRYGVQSRRENIDTFHEYRYRIVRFYAGDTPSRTIRTGLSLAQAQDHCNDPETSSRTCTNATGRARTRRLGDWFDGYTDK